MINFNHLLKSGTQLLNKNAPAILTAFGAVGVVGTAVLTGKATFEAADVLRDAKLEKAEAMIASGGVVNDSTYGDIEIARFDKVKIVWTLYVPAATSGALSVAAIVMSNRISSRRAAVLAAAYALNEGKLEEYQDKIKEKFGVKKADEVKSEIHQDRINREYDEGTVIFSPMDGKVLIREDYTGRFFWSTVEAVNKAVNEVNHEIIREGSIRLSEFHDVLGIENISLGDAFGFNQHEMLELAWDTGTTPDGKLAVHTFDYVNPPIMNPGEASFR